MSEAWPSALAAGWHPVATVAQLRAKPLARTLLGEPLVVFRGAQGPAVLRDRCPHRGMPLSYGRVRAGAIECPYHGWRFDGAGACVAVPGSDHPSDARAAALPVVERAALLWTSLAPEPAAFPALPDTFFDAALDRFWWTPAPSRARVLDALENHLDPAHPHHVHPFIVRSPDRRQPVTVSVTVDATGARAMYREAARARGLVPRLLEGERATSSGRLFPPTIGEVAFHGRRGLRFAVAVVFVPLTAELVQPYAHFATPRGIAPAWLKRVVLQAAHRPILAQDRRALARQTERAAGGYAIGPLDFLGPAIWAFAHGRVPAPEERTATILL